MAGCSVGEVTGGSDGGGSKGQVTIRLLVPVSGEGQTGVEEEMIAAFTKIHPNVKINLETQPGGTDGDNLTKTKLATGEMPEVFLYNTGSLLQALNPEQNLVDLSSEDWAGKITDSFKATVTTTKGGVYGAPIGTTSAGGVLYNKKVYADLGLKVPTTWDEYRANNEKIKAAGKTAIIQTFGSDWTAQLFVLADFGNVMAQDPDWAAQYTLNKRKYAEQPGLQGWLNQEQTAKDGFYNKDAASAVYDDGLKMLASGDGVTWPMLSSAVAGIAQNYPDAVNDIGMFPLPAQKAENTRMTMWMSNAFYIPKTATGDKLEAAKQFVAFANSEQGCQIQNEKSTATGPYSISTCQLPADAAPVLKDIQTWQDDGKAIPACEFLSPVKGPGMPNITVEVGRGIKTGMQGAQLYDQDVKKQAQQLGLPGW